MHNNRRALLYGLGAVGLWSTVATAFKISLNHLSPLALVTLAAVTSWCFFAITLTITGQWRDIWAASSRARLRSLGIGALNPALYYLVLFEAYHRLPAQEAMALNYTWALTLPLLAAPLLKQSLRRNDIIAAAISYAGVFTIATRGELTDIELANPLGILLALTSTVIWALCWIANTRQTLPPVAGLFLNFTGAVPLLVSYVWLTEGIALPAWQGLTGAVYIGFFEMGVSFILWLNAMRLTDSTARISTLIFLSPPVSLVLIWLVLGEPVMTSTLAGLALILAGLALQHSRKV